MRPLLAGALAPSYNRHWLIIATEWPFRETRLTDTITIAIDGPGASGKSVVGRRVADALGMRLLDTGAMYRAATLVALRAGVDVGDEDAVARLASSLEMNLTSVETGERLLVDGRDLTDLLRTPEVDGSVSEVSRIPAVRSVMVGRQRAIATEGPIVMVGRDIGTVVLPSATLKVFLTASAETRAQRRYLELLQKGEEADRDEITAALKHRDKIDAARKDSPMKPADDAVLVETDRLDVEEVVQIIVSRIEAG